MTSHFKRSAILDFNNFSEILEELQNLLVKSKIHIRNTRIVKVFEWNLYQIQNLTKTIYSLNKFKFLWSTLWKHGQVPDHQLTQKHFPWPILGKVTKSDYRSLNIAEFTKVKNPRRHYVPPISPPLVKKKVKKG